jgi:hypothetical protein
MSRHKKSPVFSLQEIVVSSRKTVIKKPANAIKNL